ncbi:MAG: response regulator [Desulfobacterota bacterium]|jgi:DNA-binding NtrC family response regulator|nr:response regulator [Thermodesulfobacteriota bacterium]
MSEKVLLVDDEVDFLDTLSERMRARGMEVSTSSSGAEALKKVEQESYDVIILDLMMPGVDGLEALKILKEKKPELQVILLTGHASVEKGIEAMKLGAMDFLEKPADLSQLTDKIKKAQAKKMLIVEKQKEEKIKKILEEKGW